jgi:hypothetical protein
VIERPLKHGEDSTCKTSSTEMTTTGNKEKRTVLRGQAPACSQLQYETAFAQATFFFCVGAVNEKNWRFDHTTGMIRSFIAPGRCATELNSS